jgi:hypothetical protein
MRKLKFWREDGAWYASGLSKIKIKLEQILTSHQRRS